MMTLPILFHPPHPMFEVTAKTVRLRLDYDERQYSEETMAAMARSLEEALRSLIAHSRDIDQW